MHGVSLHDFSRRGVPDSCHPSAARCHGACPRSDVQLHAQEFAEFAAARDVSEGRTPLELPYAIDGDRVGNLTIKLMFNKVMRHLLGMPQ